MNRFIFTGVSLCHLPGVAVFAALLAYLSAACGGASPSVLPSGDGGVYVALGDSVAEGENASDPEATDYVALVFDALREHYGGSLRLESLAVSGHTTQDLIEQQLPQALDFLRNGDVRVVTLTIAGNDIFGLAENSVCPTAPQNPACPFDDFIAETEGRLDTVLGELRNAGPETAIVIQVYPNPFAGTSSEGPGEYSFGRLNDLIEEVAARHDVIVADPREEFEGRAGELTGTLDSPPDFHPNDAGYEIFATAFLEALGLAVAPSESR